MENLEESERWMKDAKTDFERANRCLKERDWKGAVRNAQLTIELCSKAIISIFEEPEWTHKPSNQIRKIVKEREREIVERYGEEMVKNLLIISEDIEVSAPWHGWSVYGKEERGSWVSAADLCTVANDLMKRAERTFETTKIFLSKLRI